MALKSTMIKLGRDFSLSHRGRKVELTNQLQIRWTTLLPSITLSITATTPTTMAQASSSSLQPALSLTLTHNTTAPTTATSNTVLQLNVTRAALSNPLQSVIQTYADGALQSNVSLLALQVPSIKTMFPLAPAS